MGFREGTIVGSTLLAIGFLVGDVAYAMEPVQPSGPAPSALPSFLDDERLPVLQQAWRAREQRQQGAPQQSDEALRKGPPAFDDPMAAARAAMVRAKQLGRDESSVRQRAEELSRRFGAGTSAPVAETSPPSVTIPAAVVSEASTDQGEKHAKPEPLPLKKSVTERVTTGALAPQPEVQPLDASVRTQSVLAMERLQLAAPPPPPEVMPPLPKRAPKVVSLGAAAGATGTARKAEPSATKAAVTRVRPASRAYSSRQRSSDPKAALRGTILTNQLGAFGWNNQPE